MGVSCGFSCRTLCCLLICRSSSRMRVMFVASIWSWLQRLWRVPLIVSSASAVGTHRLQHAAVLDLSVRLITSCSCPHPFVPSMYTSRSMCLLLHVKTLRVRCCIFPTASVMKLEPQVSSPSSTRRLLLQYPPNSVATLEMLKEFFRWLCVDSSVSST